MGEELCIADTKFNEFRRMDHILETNYTFKDKLQKALYRNGKLQRSLSEAKKLIKKQTHDLFVKENFVRKKSKELSSFTNEVSDLHKDIKNEKWFMYAKSKELEHQIFMINTHVNKDKLLENKLVQMGSMYTKQIKLVMDNFENLVVYLKSKMTRLQEIFGVFENVNKKISEESKMKEKSQIDGKKRRKLIGEFTQHKLISKKRSELNRIIITIKKSVTKFSSLKKLIESYKIPGIIEDYKDKKGHLMKNLKQM